MNFSSLTLGQQFYGIGAELTPPGLFKLSVMYGKLQDAYNADTTNNIPPKFKRMAYALKAEIGDEQSFCNIVFFKATDDEQSVSFIPDTFDVKPADNLIININGATKITNNIQLSTEYASSAITLDKRSENISNNLDFEYKPFQYFYNNKTSTSYSNALKTQLLYSNKLFTTGIGYDRIAGDYISLGLPYFANDIENIRVNFSTAFLNKKIQLAVNVGKQRNNLDGDRTTSSKNTVTAINVTFNPSPKLNFIGAYSNFTSFARVESDFKYINQLYPYVDPDTLNYSQISQSGNLNFIYMLSKVGDKEKYQSVNASLAYQKVADKHSGAEHSPGANNLNANVSYIHNLISRNLSFALTFNTNIYDGAQKNATLGPTLSISKLFFEKTLRSSIAVAYNKSYVDGNSNSSVFNIRMSCNYDIKKKHSLNSSIVLLSRKSNESLTKEFTECTFTIGYRYNFGSKK